MKTILSKIGRCFVPQKKKGDLFRDYSPESREKVLRGVVKGANELQRKLVERSLKGGA